MLWCCMCGLSGPSHIYVSFAVGSEHPVRIGVQPISIENRIRNISGHMRVRRGLARIRQARVGRRDLPVQRVL